MELHPNDIGVAFHLDAFHDPVGGCGRNHKARRNVFDRLVVEGIDPVCVPVFQHLFEDAVERGTPVHRYGMGAVFPGSVLPVFYQVDRPDLGRDVLV